LSLKSPDFTTCFRVSQAINGEFRNAIASPLDPGHIKVRLPEDYAGRLTAFLAKLESLSVEPDMKALVVVNERTGTVVMGGDVRISDVVVSHNGLSIAVGSGKEVRKENLVPVQGGSIGDLVKGLNQMGVKPEDLVSILQSLHASGALKAELKLL
jgi:flagellar P-ring protein precursor FlgI